MVKTFYAKAKGSIAGLTEKIKQPKVTERHLIVLFTSKMGGEKRKWYVLGEKEPVEKPCRFKIEKREKTLMAVQKLLRPALPLFHSTNIDTAVADNVTYNHRKHFIEHHIEYDVVRVDIHNMMGTPSDSTSEKELEAAGFSFIPIEKHPQYKKLKPMVGRP